MGLDPLALRSFYLGRPMKIGETARVRGTSAARPGRTYGAGRAKVTVPIRDTVSIAGIPESDLTPKVHAAIQQLMAEVELLRGELNQPQQRVAFLERLADEDTLVPVYNRRAFVRELSRVVSYAERYGTPHTLIYFDLNGMKAINDTFGHTAGDQALLKVADALLENVRESDLVGRLGGDEFGVLLAQADEETANQKAAILAQAISETPLIWEGAEIWLSVAYGIYCFKPGENVGTALANADKAMYAHQQRNKVAA